MWVEVEIVMHSERHKCKLALLFVIFRTFKTLRIWNFRTAPLGALRTLEPLERLEPRLCRLLAPYLDRDFIGTS